MLGIQALGIQAGNPSLSRAGGSVPSTSLDLGVHGAIFAGFPLVTRVAQPPKQT